MDKADRSQFRCLSCRGVLHVRTSGLVCEICGRRYRRTSEGYYNFFLEEIGSVPDTALEEYEVSQVEKQGRLFEEYFKPWLKRMSIEKSLDVGCGIGEMVARMRSMGIEAYGVDLPGLSPYWQRFKRSREYFLIASGKVLPFPDDYFDLITSIGVLEHIGTVTGESTLRRDYQFQRLCFARELLRVCRPGGNIIISCPNKSFPLDFQHSPEDEARSCGKLRRFLWESIGVNLHPFWSPYHLLSYHEVTRVFKTLGKARAVKALSLKGFFGFSAFFFTGKDSLFRKTARGLAVTYLERMPSFFRPTCLNPYLLVKITK